MNRDFTLRNISSDINGYQQLINLRNTILPLSFEEVPIKICTWFDANLAAPLGGILDYAESKDFIVQNKGAFQIISNDGLYELADGKETYSSFLGEIHGSIVTMKINTNDTTKYNIPVETDTLEIF